MTLRIHSKIASLTILGCGNQPVSIGNRRWLVEGLECLGAIYGDKCCGDRMFQTLWETALGKNANKHGVLERTWP